MIRRNPTSGHFRSAGVNHLVKPIAQPIPDQPIVEIVPSKTIFVQPEGKRKKKFQR